MNEHDTALEPESRNERRNKAVFERAMKRFTATVEPQLPMRAEALTARRFVSIPGAMWDGPWGEQFENSIRVEIPKIKRGLRKIETDFRENRIEPDFRPAGGMSDDTTADTLDGLHRADASHFKSSQARDNAFIEAIRGGFGAYRLTNELEDPLDKDNDQQRINPGMVIVDADQRVFFDGNSKLYDKSDARFAFVITAKTKDAFEEDHPDADCSDFDDQQLHHWSFYDWYRPDVIKVCEYYEVEEVSQKLLVLRQEISGIEERYWADEISEEELAEREVLGWSVTEQRRTRRRVHKYLLSGREVLEDQGNIAGSRIPIVPVYGTREWVDDQERFAGYVGPNMDAQRLYNAKVSKLAEIDALAPRETPIFDPEQISGNLPDMWARANVDRLPYLLANAMRDAEGNIVQAGPIGYVKPPELPPVTSGLLQIANNDLTEDDRDGASEVRANTSADAMDIAAARVDAKSGIFLDNMRQSVQCEGEIYLGMAAEVYVEPGREVETMDEDGGDGKAVLGEQYTDGKGAFLTRNDFANGRYKVVASVSEATATRRDKAARRCLNMAQIAITAQDIEGAQIAIGMAVMNTDGEGISQYQEYYRKRLVQLGVMEPNEDEKAAMEEDAQNAEPDPTAVAMMAQAQELEASALLKTKQADKAVADTALSEARVVETMAKAENAGADALTKMPRIAFGRDLPPQDMAA